MEIIEALFAFIDVCGCLLEMAALFSSGTATYTGVQTYRARKNRKQHPEQPVSQPLPWFVLFVVIATALVTLVVLKYAVRP